jgi:hypothetical protein
LVGSGVSGFRAPVFFLGSGAGMTIGGATLASFGVTPGVLSEPGAEGSTGFSAKTGVPAKSNVANVKAIAACFICETSLGHETEKPRHIVANADRGSRQLAQARPGPGSLAYSDNHPTAAMFQKKKPESKGDWITGLQFNATGKLGISRRASDQSLLTQFVPALSRAFFIGDLNGCSCRKVPALREAHYQSCAWSSAEVLL